jgi:hypothetical protein
MKVLLLLALLSAPSASLRAWVTVLDTPSFRIEIEHACQEGCVSCDRLRYRATSKKTRRSIALTGSTIHTTGADGNTPSRFLGYRFVNGSTVYFVGDDGRLEVTQSGKRLLSEHGVWDPEQKKPNQAPEPTSGTVTPRAEPRVAPVPPVAQL